jgi:hypothetical protein
MAKDLDLSQNASFRAQKELSIAQMHSFGVAVLSMSKWSLYKAITISDHVTPQPTISSSPKARRRAASNRVPPTALR